MLSFQMRRLFEGILVLGTARWAIYHFDIAVETYGHFDQAWALHAAGCVLAVCLFGWMIYGMVIDHTTKLRDSIKSQGESQDKRLDYLQSQIVALERGQERTRNDSC